MGFGLRPLKKKDVPLILEWMHDQEVNHVFVTPFSRFTEEQVIAFIDSANASQTENLHLACVDDKDIYLGTVSLKNIDRENENAEYAISFRKSAHGTGASLYATQEIQRIAFEKLELERIYLYLLSINTRANRFYQKTGFVLEGVLRKHVKHNGILCDELWYGLLRSEWEEMRRRTS